MAAADAAGPWLVIGLGNPGPSYAATRHNIGARVVEVLADRVRASFKSHKTRADVVETRFGADRVVLAKPRSYMNESGGPVCALRDFFKSSPDRMVVVHDELDLPFGSLRVKSGGGDNGHNGLKSLRRSLGSGEFYRVRVGIGRPPGRQDPADWTTAFWAANAYSNGDPWEQPDPERRREFWLWYLEEARRAWSAAP